MGESVANSELDPKKRRTTRIVQAVPLTVTGVDALGRPFQERTSTLIINCHGCRYQSKHYVLKNMWVTLEVPHPETGSEPRRVRAKATWIQRPRTVRELFQIGVELETPGNVWGIAFPPEDWFPFPDNLVPELPTLSAETQSESPADEWLLPSALQLESREDNVRVLPTPATLEASQTLARQVARLVMEAKQQVQAAVGEATAAAVAAEARPLLSAIQTQMKEAAQKSVEAAAESYTEQALRQAVARLEGARQETLSQLRETWDVELQRHMQQAAPRLAIQLAEMARAHEANFEQQLQARLTEAFENLKKLSSEIAEGMEGAHSGVTLFRQQLDEAGETARRRWQEMVGGRTEEARARLEELSKTARSLNDEIAAAMAAAQAGWRGRLDADVSTATARWQEMLTAALDNAARQVADRVVRQAQGATGKLEQELTTRVAALRQSFEQSTAEAESTLGTLRAVLNKETARAKGTLAEIQQAAARMEDFNARLEQMSQATAARLEERFEEILSNESAEINRRAEGAVAGMVDRLQPVLEAAGQQSLVRLAAQLEQKLAPKIERVNDLLTRLAASQASAEETIRSQQQRAAESSERTVQETMARLQEAISRLEKEFHESGRAATAQLLAELEAKATDAQHTTFEALYKSAEWYEKKVQTHMQAALDKGLDQATGTLREKAGEISGLFASELDHYSRSFVEHAHSQMDEVAKEAVDRARGQFAHSAEASASTFGEEVRRISQREYERFSSSAAGAFDQVCGRLQTHVAEVQARVDADARQVITDFHQSLGQQIQQGVVVARAQLEAQFAPVKEAWRAEREAQVQQLQETLGRMGNDAVEAYKKRLENVSNSWLVTTVTKLSQQSQDVITQLATTAELRLRTTASEVFAGVGETLRQRLLELSASLGESTPPTEKK